MLDHVAHQLGIALELHLLHHPGFVGTDRFTTDGIFLRNIRNTHALPQQAQNIVFTVRQMLVWHFAWNVRLKRHLRCQVGSNTPPPLPPLDESQATMPQGRYPWLNNH